MKALRPILLFLCAVALLTIASLGALCCISVFLHLLMKGFKRSQAVLLVANLVASDLFICSIFTT